MLKGTLLGFICLMPTVIYADSWRLDKDLDDIKIYTREVVGSEIREFKAEVIINASLETIKSVIDDVDNYPNWFHQTSQAGILKKVSATDNYIYKDLTMPFPLDNRDLVFHSEYTKNNGEGLYIIKAQAEFCQTSNVSLCNTVNQSSNILVDTLTGEQRLIPLESGQVKMIWQIHLEPKGTVPSWLINQTLIDVPFYTLKNLRELVAIN